jgi:lipopolysaccharide export LptBFGC system permease protein LptF
MPFLVYRSMLAELLRVMALTTAVLVTVISFGATIKPLAGEDLLSAGQTARYLGLALVPMLQFALPFAAGFAATLAMHRMTVENEVLALAVSGMSYRRVLLPVMAIGLLLAAVMIGLTQWVIPRFWGMMERAITADVTTLLRTSLERGLPFRLGGIQIHADPRLIVQSDPPDTDAETRFVLLRPAVAEMDDDGQVVWDITAAQAVVDVHRRRNRTYLLVAMKDVVSYQQSEGVLAAGPTLRLQNPWIVPSPAQDDPAAMTRGELIRLLEFPDEYRQVIEARQALARELAAAEALRELDSALRTRGEIRLAAGPAEAWVIRAGGLSGTHIERGEGGVIEAVQWVDGSPARRFRAAAARLAPAPDTPVGGVAFNLELSQADVDDLRTGGRPVRRARVDAASLSLPGLPAGDLAQRTSRELLGRAASVPLASTRLQRCVAELEEELRHLGHEVRSRLAKRYALSVTAALLLLLGAVLAMWLRNTLPLQVYVIAFLPAVVDLILISGGEQMMKSGNLAGGLTVMWSGNAVLAAIGLFSYARLARH